MTLEWITVRDRATVITYIAMLPEPIRVGWLDSEASDGMADRVIRWYDTLTRSWVVYLADASGQVGDAEYVRTLPDALRAAEMLARP